SDLNKVSIALVKVQHVAHVLKLVVEFTIVDVVIVGCSCTGDGFASQVIFRQHIQGDEVSGTIVVDVGHIDSHRIQRLVPDPFFDFVGKGAVAVVDVEDVVGNVVIADINIRPLVVVEVRNGNAEAISFKMNSRFEGHVCKSSVTVVPEQAVVVQRRTVKDSRTVNTRNFVALEILQQVQVEVAILVIVEECRMLTEAHVRHTVADGLVPEHRNSFVVESLMNKQHICPVSGIFQDGGTHVNIQPPVV